MEELLPGADLVITPARASTRWRCGSSYAGVADEHLATVDGVGAALGLAAERGAHAVYLLPTYTALKEVRRVARGLGGRAANEPARDRGRPSLSDDDEHLRRPRQRRGPHAPRGAARASRSAGTRSSSATSRRPRPTSSSWAAARTASSTPSPTTCDGCDPGCRASTGGGGVVFAVCAGLQLLGRRYVAADGSELRGLGLLDLETLAAKPGEWRLIGNVVAEVDVTGGNDMSRGPRLLAGFENHGGRTTLGPGLAPLGRVVLGSGNNGRDGTEGAQTEHDARDLPARAGAAEERLADRPPSCARAQARRRRRARGAAARARGRRPARGRRGRRARRRAPPAPAGPCEPSRLPAPGGIVSGGRTQAPASHVAEQRLLGDFKDLLGPGDLPDVPGLEVGVLYQTRSGAGAAALLSGLTRSRGSAAISSTSSAPARCPSSSSPSATSPARESPPPRAPSSPST